MESLREVYDGCYRRLVGQLYAPAHGCMAAPLSVLSTAFFGP